MTELWSYRDTARTQTTDVVGFEVVATDGSIGKVNEATSACCISIPFCWSAQERASTGGIAWHSGIRRL